MTAFVNKSIGILSGHRVMTLLDQAVVSGSNFLVGVILIRFIGMESYGVFAAAWLLLLFTSSISQALLIKPLMSLGPGQSDFSNFCSKLLGSQIGFAILAALCFRLFIPFAEGISGFEELKHLSVSGPTLILSYLLYDHLRRQALTGARPFRSLWIDLIAYGSALLSMLLFALYAELTASLAVAVLAGGFGLAVLAALPGHPFPSLSPVIWFRTVKIHFKYSRWLLGTAILQWVSGQWHGILAGALLGPAALGAFRLALQVMGLLHVIYQAVENHVPVSASRIHHHLGRSAMINYLFRMGLLLSAANIITLTLIAFLREPLMLFFFGSEALPHALLIVALVPAYALIPAAMPARFAARSLGQTRIIFQAYVAAAAFSLLSAYPLISQWGLWGAAAGLAGNQALLFVLLLYPFRKEYYQLCRSYI